MLFTKRPIDFLTNNIVERLRVSSIKILFDKWMYESSHQNSKFDDLAFDGDERLITRWRIYRINDDIIERLNNGLIDDVYTNQIWEEYFFSLMYWLIDHQNCACDHILGAFHNNFPGFSGFEFFRKLTHTKTQQGIEKASRHNWRTVFLQDLVLIAGT